MTNRSNLTLTDGAAFVRFDIEDDMVFILDMDTPPERRRKGVMCRLIDRLRSLYPEHRIIWGFLSEDGAAFIRAYQPSVEMKSSGITEFPHEVV